MKPALRLSAAAPRLGITEKSLRKKLQHLGAITSQGTAHPNWVREGWLQQEDFQYYHKSMGWRWASRIDITEAGLVELFGLIDSAAA